MPPVDPLIIAALVSLCSAVGVAALTNLGTRRTATTAPYRDLADRVHELEQHDRSMRGRVAHLTKRLDTLQTALDAWTRWWNALETDWEHARTRVAPPPPPKESEIR